MSIEDILEKLKSGIGHDVKGTKDSRRIVTTAGTRVTLYPVPGIAAKAVLITAEDDNTGIVVVGGDTVVAALATRRGTPLDAGDSVALACDNLKDIFLDSTVSGDGVTFTYLIGG